MFDESVTVLTYPTEVIRGRATPDYTADPTETLVTGCDVQPGSSTELLTEQRQGAEIAYTVYAPATAPITSQTIIRCRGDLCQVDGDPQRWTGPLAHLQVALVSWEPRS